MAKRKRSYKQELVLAQAQIGALQQLLRLQVAANRRLRANQK